MNISGRAKIGTFVISVLILLVALSLFLKRGMLSFRSDKEVPSLRIIGLLEAQQKYADGTHLFLDAREAILFRLGHIINSINFPPGDYDDMIDNFKKKYPKETRIIIYCGGSSCSSSYALAKKLAGEGYRGIEIFWGGWNEWVKGNLPIERDNA